MGGLLVTGCIAIVCSGRVAHGTSFVFAGVLAMFMIVVVVIFVGILQGFIAKLVNIVR